MFYPLGDHRSLTCSRSGNDQKWSDTKFHSLFLLRIKQAFFQRHFRHSGMIIPYLCHFRAGENLYINFIFEAENSLSFFKERSARWRQGELNISKQLWEFLKTFATSINTEMQRT